MKQTAVLVALVVSIGGLAACGQEAAPGASGGGTNPDAGAGTGSGGSEVQGVGTVLESQDHKPQLCLGAVDESYPPQCGGPELVGWDWAHVTGAETANGSTWGNYAVTGTWDGTRLTVTEVGLPEDAEQPTVEDPNFMTPCDPPAGGWAVVDADTATDEAMQRALQEAALEPDYSGAWVDQSINPAFDSGTENETSLNDPAKLVLNVIFTGDLERHEAAIRAVWGGPLCVSIAPRSQADLLAIQAALTDEPGVLGSAPDERAGTLEVSVMVEDGLQQRMDATYGVGVVVVMPSLLPVG